MRLTIEQKPACEVEHRLAELLENKIKQVGHSDVRDYRKTIEKELTAMGINNEFVLGCGSSHVWIHRAIKLPSGSVKASEQRFAIITEG